MSETSTILVWSIGVVFASTLFTACSLLILAACRNGSAAMRCKITMLAAVGLVALPALSAFSPKLSLGWLMLDADSQLVTQTTAFPIQPSAFSADPEIATQQVPNSKSVPTTFATPPEHNETHRTNPNQPSVALQQEGQESSKAIAFEQSSITQSSTSWLSWLVLGYVTGLVVLVGRLFVELAWAWRAQRQAEPFPTGITIARRLRPSGIEKFEVLSADVPVPMVVGILRSAILVPRQADAWSDPQLTSALSHELAHIDRKDLRMQLICSIVRCFYWPQPLVHMLLKRLRADMELACDQMVVSQYSHPVEYARHLLNIASECTDNPQCVSTAAPMFRRGEAQRGDLEIRVAAVLSPITQHQPKLTWLLAAMLLFCLLCSAIPTPVQAITQTPELATNEANRSDNSADKTEASTSNKRTDTGQNEKFNVWRVSGTVVDSRGRPVPNASIATWLQGEIVFHRSSDSSGQFALEIAKTGVLDRPHTWFFAPGLGVRAALLPMHEKLKYGDSLSEVEIPLPPIAEEPLGFRILDPIGKPLAGATVRPHSIDWPNGRFMADAPTGLSGPPPKPVSDFLAVQSDAAGRVALSKVPAALMRSIVVESKEYGLQEFRIGYRKPGEQLDLRLLPAAPLYGRLLAPETANLEGIKLEIVKDHYLSDDTQVRGLASVPLNKRGEFSIPKFPIQGSHKNLRYSIGWSSRSRGWDPNADFQPAFRDAKIRKTEQGYYIEIPTVPTVLVQGMVKTQDTDRPLSGVHMSFRNPSLGTPHVRAATNDEGVYRVNLPTGDSTNQIFAVLDREEPGKYGYATTELQVPDSAGTFEVPAVYLAPVPKIAGILRDAAGTPAAGVRIGVRDPNPHGHFSGIGESQLDGRFDMPIYDASKLPSGRLQRLEWFEIVKSAEGTKPQVLRELEVLDRNRTATVLRRKR